MSAIGNDLSAELGMHTPCVLQALCWSEINLEERFGSITNNFLPLFHLVLTEDKWSWCSGAFSIDPMDGSE